MKKTFQVTLNSVLFKIEEDAYEKLKFYLDSIKDHYENRGEGEILIDIEAGIAEKFTSLAGKAKKVITIKDVEEAILVMGTVEEMDPLEGDSGEKAKKKPGLEPGKKLYRNGDDVIIAGVCSGIGYYLGIDSVFIRIIFILLVFANGIGVIIYLVLWLLMPMAKNTAQKLEMQGEPVNLKKMEESLKKKSAEIKKDWEASGRKGFKKIISFPFEILKLFTRFINRIFRNLSPILRVFTAVMIILGTLFGIVFLGLAVGAAFFSSSSSIIISDIDFRAGELANSFYVFLGFGYLSFFIPLFIILLLAVSLLRKKHVLNTAILAIFALFWVMSVTAAGLSAFQIAPFVKDKFDQASIIGTASRDFEFENVKSIRLGTSGRAMIKEGEDFSMRVSGQGNILADIEPRFENGELLLTGPKPESYDRRGICVFCLPSPVLVEITAPDLESLKIFGNTEAQVEGFSGKNFRLNAEEKAEVKANLPKTNLSSYIAGLSGRIELLSSPKTINVEMEGMGRLEGDNLDAEEIIIMQSAYSSVRLKGKTLKLTASLEDRANLEAGALLANEISLDAGEFSNSVIFPINALRLDQDVYANVKLQNEPVLLEKRKKDENLIERR